MSYLLNYPGTTQLLTLQLVNMRRGKEMRKLFNANYLPKIQ